MDNKLEQMDNKVDQTLIIGVLSKLLPFLVNDKGEKSYGDREKLTDTIALIMACFLLSGGGMSLCITAGPCWHL